MNACNKTRIAIMAGECGREAILYTGHIEVEMFEFTFDPDECVSVGSIIGNMQTVAKYISLASGANAHIQFMNVEDETDCVAHYVFRLKDNKDLSVEYVYVLVEDGEIYHSPFNWDGSFEGFVIPDPVRIQDIW